MENKLFFYVILLVTLSLHNIFAEEIKAEQQTSNVVGGEGFKSPSEEIIDNKAQRSPLLDSIFNFLWNFGIFAGGVLTVERLLRMFCSINLGIFSANDPPTPNLPMLKKEK